MVQQLGDRQSKPSDPTSPVGIALDETQVYGIESNETPLVYFSLVLDAGRDRGAIEKPAVASLTADLLNKGTAEKTTAELEDAIKSLGSNIEISAGATSTTVTGSSLSRNFSQTMALVEATGHQLVR